MYGMRDRLDWHDPSVPMAALFVMAVFLAVVANIVAAAWIAGL